MKLVLKIYEVAIELPENAHPLLLKMTKTHPQSLCGVPISSGRDFLDIPCNYLLVHNPYHRYQMLPLKRSSRTTASGGSNLLRRRFLLRIFRLRRLFLRRRQHTWNWKLLLRICRFLQKQLI